MSTFIPKPNTGTLFVNNKKEDDRHPDMTGNIFLSKDLVRERLEATEGDELVQISISAWNNDGGRIGLMFKKPYVKPVDQKTQAAEPEAQKDPDDDSDIPF